MLNKSQIEQDLALAEKATYTDEVRCLDWTDEDGVVHITHFKDDPDSLIPAYTVEGVLSIGDHECGAMEKHNADFIARARTARPFRASLP